MIELMVSITGIVQGVFYRQSTKDKAMKYNITGWVKNCMDGSVEAKFQGKKENIDAILAWCKQGPTNAIVKNVTILSSKDCTIRDDRFTII